MRTDRLARPGALLLVAALLAACGGGASGSGGAAPGVTKTTVTIGSHQPLTGRAAPGYSKISAASKAYFEWVNAAGGVHGRTIVYKYLDDAYNPVQTVSVVRKLVQQDKVFAIFNGLGTPTHSKVLDFLNTNKVPDLFVASGCTCWDQAKKYPQTFGFQVDYTREGKILGSYIAQRYAGKKVAYFLQGDDFGKDGAKGLDRFIPKDSVVSRQTYQSGNLDVGPLVGAIAQSKAEVVVLMTVPAYTALFKLAALKLGYSPQIVVSNVGADPTTLSGLLEKYAAKGGVRLTGSPLIQGIVSDGYLPATGDTGNSWISLFRKVHAKYLASESFDGNVVYGMAAAYAFAQALQDAGKNPTRASLLAAVEKGGVSGPGLTSYAYSKDSHSGLSGAQVGTIVGTTLVLSGPVRTTDGGDGPVTDYTGQQAEAPANGLPQ